MIRALFASLTIMLALAGTASAQNCNPASGFVVQNGTVAIGDLTAWGPQCGQIESATGVVPSLIGNNFWQGHQYFGSGVPWCDPREKGALGNGVTDDTGAFESCRDELISIFGSGMIYVSAGHYCLNSLPINTANMRIFGENQGVFLDVCNKDVNLLALNADSIMVENLTMRGAGINASGSSTTVSLNGNCVRCYLYNVVITGGSNAVFVGAPDVHIHYSRLSSSYNNAILLVAGTAAGGFFERDEIDQNWQPGCIPAAGTFAPTNWAPSHTYGACAVAITQDGKGTNWYIQTVGGGASGGSAPTLLNYEVNIPDGGVTWQLVAPVTYYARRIEGGSVNNYFHWTDTTGPYTSALIVQNTIGGDNPAATILDGDFVGDNIGTALSFTAGENVVVQNTQIANCVSANCTAVSTSGIFSDGFTFGPGNLIYNQGGGSSIGVLLGAGVNSLVTGNNLFPGGVGVNVAGGVSRFTITSNFAGVSPSFGSNAECINVANGASNHFGIALNDCTGATSSAVTIGTGAGANRYVLNDGAIQAASLGLFGATSGVLTQTAPAIAGTAAIGWGTNSGTPAVSASAPLAINTGTGNIACPTCFATTSAAAVTETNDTNVTMSLGGSPSTSALAAWSMTLGWTGTLASSRGGRGIASPAAHSITSPQGASPDNVIGPCATGQTIVWASGTGTDPSCASLFTAMFSWGNTSAGIIGGTTDFCGSPGGCQTTQIAASFTPPLAGTLKNYIVNVSAAPGTGQNYTFTILTGTFGAATPSAITCTIANAATQCQDTTHTAALTLGQVFVSQIVTSITATTLPQLSTGISYTSP